MGQFKLLVAVLLPTFILISVHGISPGNFVFYNCTVPGQYAITFDDGPHPSLTTEVLDFLRNANVSATFFIQGFGVWEGNYTRYVGNVQRAFAEGHQIGNHAWSHPDMTNITAPEIRSQLADMEALIVEILGVRPTIFRPPFGIYDDQLVGIAKNEFSYEVIMWNIDTWDWSHPGNTSAGMEEYYQAIETNLHPNYIALHHDVQMGAVELAFTAIQYMRYHGFTPVTIAECIGVPKFR